MQEFNYNDLWGKFQLRNFCFTIYEHNDLRYRISGPAENLSSSIRIIISTVVDQERLAISKVARMFNKSSDKNSLVIQYEIVNFRICYLAELNL